MGKPGGCKKKEAAKKSPEAAKKRPEAARKARRLQRKIQRLQRKARRLQGKGPQAYQNPSKPDQNFYKIDKQSFIEAILAQDKPGHRFYMIFGRFGMSMWRPKMIAKSIPKSNHFQVSVEFCVLRYENPKAPKRACKRGPKLFF